MCIGESERAFAIGDRLQFTAPFRDQHVANRELGTITGLTPASMKVQLDSGRRVWFHVKDYAHVDYGYAVTSHSSQGHPPSPLFLSYNVDRMNGCLASTMNALSRPSRERLTKVSSLTPYLEAPRPMRRMFLRIAFQIAVVMGGAPDMWAQGGPPVGRQPDVAITIQGIASLQPGDDSYVGQPYLNEGLGGVAPGVALGLSIAAHRRLVFAFEFSTAALEVQQTGRLVSGGAAVGRLRDSLYSGLAGASVWSSAAARVVALAGASVVSGSVSQNGVSIDKSDDPAVREGDGPIAFTAGVDATRRVRGRIGVGATVRYSAVPRSRRARELGVGAQVLRIGGGVQIRLDR